MSMQFRVLPEHIILLQQAYVSWNDCETGAPTIDPKRPYGNSSVMRDMVKMLNLGWDYENITNEQYQYLWKLHKETEQVLTIFLQTGVMAPGLYQKEDNYSSSQWKWVNA